MSGIPTYRREELLVVAVEYAVEQAPGSRQLPDGSDHVRVLHELLAQLVAVQADQVRQQRVQHEGLVRAQLHAGEGGDAVQQQLGRLTTAETRRMVAHTHIHTYDFDRSGCTTATWRISRMESK